MNAPAGTERHQILDALLDVKKVAVADLSLDPMPHRDHTDHQISELARSFERFGQDQPLVVQRQGMIVRCGNGRLRAAQRLGWTHIAAVVLDRSEAEMIARGIADNRLADLGISKDSVIAEMLMALAEDDISVPGFTDAESAALIRSSLQPAGPEGGQLRARFLVPPFTLLDARQGYWMERKRAWLALGMDPAAGRAEELLGGFSSAARLQRAYGGRSAKGTRSESAPARESGGTSNFDPVLAEVSYRWFAPPRAVILDPFAGGCVRGVVAALLGHHYVGVDLRPEQVAANVGQWADIVRRGAARPVPVAGAGAGADLPDSMPERTPVERRGDYWLKRDDLFRVAGIGGGKVRSCWHLAQGAPGLVTAGSRSSPQCNIVAQIAARLGIPCALHTPSGTLSDELELAASTGAEVVQHRAGRNSVIKARAREDAAERGWVEIPFGMECQEAVEQTRGQAENLPEGPARIVVPVGSGMSLSGILWGLRDRGLDIPVLGVCVGADPRPRLARWAPEGWETMVELVDAGVPYHEAVEGELEGVRLDSVYEAKCLPFLRPGDLLWIVGIRQSEAPSEPRGAEGASVDPGAEIVAPGWVSGDAAAIGELDGIPDEVDFVYSCPPYFDLERYSRDPADMSNAKTYADFLEVYGKAIRASCARLRPNRFAAFVVGDIRDRAGGAYRGFVADTVRLFGEAGLAYYNHAIYITNHGTLPIRAGRIFSGSRKLGKAHQDLLVFVKGDPEAAHRELGPPGGADLEG